MNKIQSFFKRNSQKIVAVMLVSIALYGLGRLYFLLTDGFTVGNITADVSAEPDHGLERLSIDQLSSLSKILDQPFRYLGKGRQSYAFVSADGNYVVKFLKFQRFRPAAFLSSFDFMPAVEKYRQKKLLAKRKELNALLDSWKVAFRYLPEETGIIYLHLNFNDEIPQRLNIVDKVGFKHEIETSKTLFLVQRCGKMLCRDISTKMRMNDLEGSKKLIAELVDMLQDEYKRGFGDTDHELMQNTGVIDGKPMHIDVGEIIRDEKYKDPKTSAFELFSKTYKLRIWLAKEYPELENYLADLLYDRIGPEMQKMRPDLRTVEKGD